jgi:tetratricopeptide (TPR) repeat protein
MRTRNIFWPVAIAGQLCLFSMAQAQLLDDVEIKSSGKDAVAVIRFSAPVQFQRSIAAKSGDLVQIFYNILPRQDSTITLVGERRIAGGNGLPQLVVTDEAVSSDDLYKRKLLVRLSQSVGFKVRAGRTKETLEIVLDGLGPQVSSAAPQPKVKEPGKHYAVLLQSSTDPGGQLKASIPAILQEAEVFTSSRVADGKTRYEISLGYFDTQAEADNAQRILVKRFPDAAVVSLRQAPAPQPAAAVAQSAETGTAPAVIASAPEVEANAAKLMAVADAANDRGDYQDAITALGSLLNLPPNTRTRKAQEQIGLTRLKAGDNQRARGEFETFLKLYPTGADSEQIRQYLVNLPTATTAVQGRGAAEPVSTTNGSVSVFYYGGQSQTRSQDFADSPVGGLPVLQSESNLSGTDQKQVQTNVDLNWRYRDAEKDMRFVVRDTYSADLMPNRPNKNRLSALYFDQRSLTNGTAFKVGRQSPVGGGVLYRFDGLQASYTFAPKWKLNGVYGVPTDLLLDSRRYFYGAWVDADALAPNMSGSVYFNQQMIDEQVDRSAVGAELRYFNEGLALSGQMDYDQVLQGLNIATVQGSWQFPDTTVINFLFDRRATPVRSLGNILFFQDPTLPTPARSISELLGTTPIDMLRGQVNGITSFQTQGMVGFTTPVAANWQAGANVNYTNVDEIKPIAVILPNGQPSTGDLWSVGLQMIGSNLYSARDTHVFNASFLSGPTYKGTLLSYNNLTGINQDWQVEPSLRLYVQDDSLGNKMKRWTPGIRMTYRVIKRISLETELSYEIADTTGPTRNESSQRMFYYLGARFDF